MGAFLRAPRRAAAPRVAHALLLDVTHDNPSPLERRSVFDVLPAAALVAMACCASGSTRGLDELVPHAVHVVDEERQYAEWGAAPQQVGAAAGVLSARRALNELHYELAAAGYDEVTLRPVLSALSFVRSVLLTCRYVLDLRGPNGRRCDSRDETRTALP